MPGTQTEGFVDSQPEAYKANKQDSEKDTLPGDIDEVDPKYGPEVEKAFHKNVGSNKAGNDTRGNHDSNTRQVGS